MEVLESGEQGVLQWDRKLSELSEPGESEALTYPTVSTGGLAGGAGRWKGPRAVTRPGLPDPGQVAYLGGSGGLLALSQDVWSCHFGLLCINLFLFYPRGYLPSPYTSGASFPVAKSAVNEGARISIWT